MSVRNLEVPSEHLTRDQSSQNVSISSVRSSNSIENSRAQLASSDIRREPRRPSMTLEQHRREPENRHVDERRRSVNVHRGTRRQSEHVLGERRASNAGRRSSNHTEEHHHNEINRDRRVPNGHVPRENDQNGQMYTHSEHTQTHYHQRPYSDPRTGRDLPRADSVTQRRRDFQGVSSARTRGSNFDDEYDKDDRYVVPALPMPIAVICCVLNFIIPGFGSMTAALCVLCCAKTEDMTCGEKLGSCCTVFGIGLLQLLLVACFLIGWIWSCIWGITFIGMSASYYEDNAHYDDYYTDTNNPAYRGAEATVRGRTPLPTPQVVVDQPFPGIRYDDIERDRRRREAHRRTRSRISLTPSNLIYPMRAPSNIHYNSPPPPYPDTTSPPPAYRRDQADARRENSSSNRISERQRQHTTTTIPEEHR